MSSESPEENRMTGAKEINAELPSNSWLVDMKHILLTFKAFKQTRGLKEKEGMTIW